MVVPATGLRIGYDSSDFIDFDVNVNSKCCIFDAPSFVIYDVLNTDAENPNNVQVVLENDLQRGEVLIAAQIFNPSESRPVASDVPFPFNGYSAAGRWAAWIKIKNDGRTIA